MLIPIGGLLRQVNISEAHIPPWKIQFKTECRQWFKSLSEDDKEHLSNIFELLREDGPDLGRPYVDRIKGSSFIQMKEIRTNQGIRILFIFDTKRTATMLVGGNKSEREDTTPNWNRWYAKMIPVAEEIYRKHLIEIGETRK